MAEKMKNGGECMGGQTTGESCWLEPAPCLSHLSQLTQTSLNASFKAQAKPGIWTITSCLNPSFMTNSWAIMAVLANQGSGFESTLSSQIFMLQNLKFGGLQYNITKLKLY